MIGWQEPKNWGVKNAEMRRRHGRIRGRQGPLLGGPLPSTIGQREQVLRAKRSRNPFLRLPTTEICSRSTTLAQTSRKSRPCTPKITKSKVLLGTAKIITSW